MRRRAWEAVQSVLIVTALAAIAAMFAAAGVLSRPWGIR